MADLIRQMEEGHETADIDGVINEVAEARGTYDTLDDRLDAMGGAPSPSSSTPAMDGTASAGESDEFARGDHVHPIDISRQAALSIVDTTVVLGTDNTSITWNLSNNGIYYSNDIAVSGISTVYAVSIKGFIGLAATDVIQPMISSNGTKIRFMANTNTFQIPDTSLIVRVVGT